MISPVAIVRHAGHQDWIYFNKFVVGHLRTDPLALVNFSHSHFRLGLNYPKFIDNSLHKNVSIKPGKINVLSFITVWDPFFGPFHKIAPEFAGWWKCFSMTKNLSNGTNI